MLSVCSSCRFDVVCVPLVAVKVYTLTRETEELKQDRDRVRLALEQTEASMLRYSERADQQEQREGSGHHEVSVT